MSSPQNKIIIFAVCVGILSLLAPLNSYSNNSRIVRQRSLPSDNPVEMKTNYGNLPLSFIRNDGQVDSKVQYLERGNGHTVFFTSDGVVFSLQPKQSTTNTAFKLSPVNANKSPKITGEGLQQTRFNYLRGSDPKQWQQNVPAYGAIRYHDIYPGVDMRFYGNQRELEYDIIVQPGKNPDSIRLAYEGIESLKITVDGNLEINFKNGKMLQKKPFIYQEIDGKHTEVAGQFKAIDASSTYGFEIAPYDKHHPLIIDPTLMYASFLGGTADDVGRDIDVDSSGNAYIVGATYSLDFPVTTGTYDMTYNAGFRDTFIAKLDATGSYLVYATYIGGSGAGVLGDDFGDHIAVDSQGNAYISGFTNSTDFPTTAGALDTTYNGGADAFIVKLNATGTTLLYSTYLGGSDYDLGGGIAVDTSGNLYITGQTLSSDFPTTVGAYDRTYDASLGQSDAYVAKLNPTGTALVYSTFLGGGNADFGDGIAIDSSRYAYVTGNTASTNFPVTTGAYDTSYNGGSSDTFVAKLNTTGTGLVFSTYLGGSGGEQNDARTSIGLDAAGNIFVSGSTTSVDFPTTSGAFQTTVGGPAGIQHPFVTKFNSTGTARLYSTYIAGTVADAVYSLAVDAGGDAYIVGYTGSSDFPTTTNAYRRSLGGPDGGFDLFITRLNSTGNALVYSSYLGGSSWESGNGVAIDANGNAYVTGITSSSDFPATPGAYTQSLNIGGQFNLDAFVAKFDTAPPTISAVTSGSITLSGATITWTTNEISDTQVEFGTTTSYGNSTPLNTTLATNHSASLSGLAASTLYHYRVMSRDGAGNLATSGDYTFTTVTPTPGIDQDFGIYNTGTYVKSTTRLGQTFTTASTTTNISAVNMVIDTRYWTTGEILTLTLWNGPSRTVNLGSKALADTAKNQTFTFDTPITVSPSTQYYFELTHNGGGDNSVGWIGYKSTGGYSLGAAYVNGTAQAYDFDFTTYTISGTTPPPADTQAPTGTTVTINAGAAYTNTTSVTLTLTCTDNVACTQMQVAVDGTADSEAWIAYATSTAATLAVGDGTKTVAVKFRDAAGNTSAQVTDTIVLDTTAPTLSSIASSGITSSGATITWTTNEASDTQVDFGATTSYGTSTTLNASLVTSHSAGLSGLAASTLYHYRVRSRDAAGNLSVSGDYSFTTPVSTAPLSQGKPTTASSTYSSNIPANVVDGSISTMWNSGGTAPRWVYVDLGAVFTISHVNVLAGTGSPAGTTTYDIQVSNDTATWTTVVSNATNGSATVYTTTPVSASARYVRIYVKSHSGNSWIALYEVQVY